MVGRAVLRRLKEEGNIEVLSAPHQELDLTKQADTYEWLGTYKPDIVIMTAGKVGGIGENSAAPAEFLYDNLAMAQNVIHGAFKAKVQKLLYLGSSCIYPKFAEQPIKESALLTGALEQTNEAYALAKITGIKLCEYYYTQHHCDFISAMPANLYGPHDHFNEQKSHVIPALILKIHQAKINNEASVQLWVTGKPLREFLHVDDLADGLIHLLKNYSNGTHINIGSGQEITIHDLAKIISDVIGYKGRIEFDSRKPDGTPRKLLDSSKLQAMGWEAETVLNKGIEEVYDWFFKNH